MAISLGIYPIFRQTHIPIISPILHHFPRIFPCFVHPKSRVEVGASPARRRRRNSVPESLTTFLQLSLMGKTWGKTWENPGKTWENPGKNGENLGKSRKNGERCETSCCFMGKNMKTSNIWRFVGQII